MKTESGNSSISWLLAQPPLDHNLHIQMVPQLDGTSSQQKSNYLTLYKHSVKAKYQDGDLEDPGSGSPHELTSHARGEGGQPAWTELLNCK